MPRSSGQPAFRFRATAELRHIPPHVNEAQSYPIYVVIDRDGNIASVQRGAGGEDSLRDLLHKGEHGAGRLDAGGVVFEYGQAPTILADQLFTKAPRRSSASGKFSPAAAKPRRKCEGISKQSPGASRMPCSAAAWQNGRSCSPLTSQGNAVMPPCGGIQPSTSLWSDKNRSSSLRFPVAVAWVLPRTTSRWRMAISERISPVVVLEIEK